MRPGGSVDTGTAATPHQPGGYLKPPFNWRPMRPADIEQTEYQFALGDGRTAYLRLVAGKGWAMRITGGPGQETDRGLFGTPHDALMVLVAESGASLKSMLDDRP